MMRTQLVFLFVLSFYGTAMGQLLQRRPEFCGTPGVLVPVPHNVSAASFPGKGSDLFVRPDAAPVRLDMDYDIDQVCELPDGRIVVFGSIGDWGTNVSVVDVDRAALVDTFLVLNPVLSPDRRWIVYHKFFPRSTELPVSAEYLLYDLSKTPAQNRPYESFSLDALNGEVGKAIYPAGWKNEPGDHIGVPETQQHSSRSTFFWSPDSRAIVFSDLPRGGKPELVLIAIDKAGATTASIYRYDFLSCKGEEGAIANGRLAQPSIRFGPEQGADLSVFLDLESPGCSPLALRLRRQDFRPAKTEKRVVEKPTRRTIRGNDQ